MLPRNAPANAISQISFVSSIFRYNDVTYEAIRLPKTLASNIFFVVEFSFTLSPLWILYKNHAPA